MFFITPGEGLYQTAVNGGGDGSEKLARILFRAMLNIETGRLLFDWNTGKPAARRLECPDMVWDLSAIAEYAKEADAMEARPSDFPDTPVPLQIPGSPPGCETTYLPEVCCLMVPLPALRKIADLLAGRELPAATEEDLRSLQYFIPWRATDSTPGTTLLDKTPVEWRRRHFLLHQDSVRQMRSFVGIAPEFIHKSLPDSAAPHDAVWILKATPSFETGGHNRMCRSLNVGRRLATLVLDPWSGLADIAPKAGSDWAPIGCGTGAIHAYTIHHQTPQIYMTQDSLAVVQNNSVYIYPQEVSKPFGCMIDRGSRVMRPSRFSSSLLYFRFNAWNFRMRPADAKAIGIGDSRIEAFQMFFDFRIGVDLNSLGLDARFVNEIAEAGGLAPCAICEIWKQRTPGRESADVTPMRKPRLIITYKKLHKTITSGVMSVRGKMVARTLGSKKKKTHCCVCAFCFYGISSLQSNTSSETKVWIGPRPSADSALSSSEGALIRDPNFTVADALDEAGHFPTVEGPIDYRNADLLRTGDSAVIGPTAWDTVKSFFSSPSLLGHVLGGAPAQVEHLHRVSRMVPFLSLDAGENDSDGDSDSDDDEHDYNRMEWLGRQQTDGVDAADAADGAGPSNKKKKRRPDSDSSSSSSSSSPGGDPWYESEDEYEAEYDEYW